MKQVVVSIVCLVFALVTSAMGCAAPTPGSSGTATLAPATTAAVVPTVVRVTLAPATIAPGTPTAVRVTPAPTIAGDGVRLSLTALKYKLLEVYRDFFFCDPDFYPVARDDEEALALQRFPDIQKNAEVYQTILAHTSLDRVANLSNQQKLTVYRDYKRLNAVLLEPAGDEYKFNLRIGEKSGGIEGFAIEGRITQRGAITETKRQPTVLMCPICLAADTLIDTPGGQVPVQDLKVGMTVWTQSAEGARVPSMIVKTARVTASVPHALVSLRLADGRELRVSPGHPTADGRAVGALRAGDWLDGARVLRVERVVYADGATYDLLPSGDSGYYWANGILLGSTLR